MLVFNSETCTMDWTSTYRDCCFSCLVSIRLNIISEYLIGTSIPKVIGSIWQHIFFCLLFKKLETPSLSSWGSSEVGMNSCELLRTGEDLEPNLDLPGSRAECLKTLLFWRLNGCQYWLEQWRCFWTSSSSHEGMLEVRAKVYQSIWAPS